MSRATSDTTRRRDERMMRLALRQAARGAGRTHPNPSVGAVVYRGERVLGRGYSRPAGGAHAEVVAIEAARRRHGARAMRGAAMAVTLEPCNHQGRTGPCTEAILEAGIARVVVGCRDPHPTASGGIRRLRRRGVGLEVGVLEQACRWHHRGFLSVHERGRPHVVLKLATSLDGRIALANGASRWITSPESRAFVHRLRDASDAIMVGAETARVDDPALDVRRDGRIVRRPIRVLIDGRLRVPASARLFSGGPEAETWVVCGRGARGRVRARSVASRLIEVPRRRDGFVDLRRAMRRLAEEGLTTVLVEGGGRLAAALLRSDLVDEVHWMLAPKLIGADGRPGLGPLALGRLADAVVIDPIRIRRRGPDLHVHGTVRRS
jgi:diaminohydroxyphosphoribosylaminopyrimidine deaminase/5-amino-6-(5-phosphoribosylamino)uracil reductase